MLLISTSFTISFSLSGFEYGCIPSNYFRFKHKSSLWLMVNFPQSYQTTARRKLAFCLPCAPISTLIHLPDEVKWMALGTRNKNMEPIIKEDWPLYESTTASIAGRLKLQRWCENIFTITIKIQTEDCLHAAAG